MGLRKKVFQTSALLTVVRWTRQAIRAASYIILARHLEPADFGIAMSAKLPSGLFGMIAAGWYGGSASVN